MSLAEAFERDVCDNPGDRGLRLIYADWLEDQGDRESVERAELVRLQLELEGLTDDDPRQWALSDRADAIIHNWGPRWTEPVRELVRSERFHGGFVEEVEL